MGVWLKHTVLVVEDNAEDVVLLKRAFRKAGIANPLNVVKDGEEAIKYLSGMDTYADRTLYPMPFLMLLDLRLPRFSGFEVLGWIRNQPAFNGLTIVVLTVSDNVCDMNKAQELGANSYLVKSDNFDELMALVKRIGEGRWLLMDERLQRPSAKETRTPDRIRSGAQTPEKRLRNLQPGRTAESHRDLPGRVSPR